MPRTHNQVRFTRLDDSFSTYIDPHWTSTLHHHCKAPIPCPGQPNRSTRFLYRPNIVAGCNVVRCGRPKPVSVTLLQHRALKRTVQCKAQFAQCNRTTNPSKCTKQLAWVTWNWHSWWWNFQIFHAATNSTALSDAARPRPHMCRACKRRTAQISGARQTSAPPRTVDLANNMGRLPTKANAYCQLYRVARRENYQRLTQALEQQTSKTQYAVNEM